MRRIKEAKPNTYCLGSNECPNKYKYGESSARCMPIGYIFQLDKYKYKLCDKFICEINKCPNCHSKNTFHSRQQKLGDMIANVWRFEVIENDNLIFSKKWDICLKCGNEFLIEYFFLLRLK